MGGERRQQTSKTQRNGRQPCDHASDANGDAAPKITRILLVDGSDEVRRGVTIALTIADDLWVVGAAASGSHALEACVQLRPHVVLMETRIKDQDGIGLIRLVREQFPDVQVVVLTSDPTAEMRDRARSAGAIQVLQKYVTVDELITAIRSAHVQHDVPPRRTETDTDAPRPNRPPTRKEPT
jgi:DNA-binding NarL/FixJ family response regulator